MNNDTLLRCPLTGKIFNQPVSTRNGCTYEKQAIKDWMNTNKYSPAGMWISKDSISMSL